jgi:hypothetical protein
MTSFTHCLWRSFTLRRELERGVEVGRRCRGRGASVPHSFHSPIVKWVGNHKPHGAQAPSAHPRVCPIGGSRGFQPPQNPPSTKRKMALRGASRAVGDSRTNPRTPPTPRKPSCREESRKPRTKRSAALGPHPIRTPPSRRAAANTDRASTSPTPPPNSIPRHHPHPATQADISGLISKCAHQIDRFPSDSDVRDQAQRRIEGP